MRYAMVYPGSGGSKGLEINAPKITMESPLDLVKGDVLYYYPDVTYGEFTQFGYLTNINIESKNGVSSGKNLCTFYSTPRSEIDLYQYNTEIETITYLDSVYEPNCNYHTISQNDKFICAMEGDYSGNDIRIYRVTGSTIVKSPVYEFTGSFDFDGKTWRAINTSRQFATFTPDGEYCILLTELTNDYVEYANMVLLKWDGTSFNVVDLQYTTLNGNRIYWNCEAIFMSNGKFICVGMRSSSGWKLELRQYIIDNNRIISFASPTLILNENPGRIHMDVSTKGMVAIGINKIPYLWIYQLDGLGNLTKTDSAKTGAILSKLSSVLWTNSGEQLMVTTLYLQDSFRMGLYNVSDNGTLSSIWSVPAIPNPNVTNGVAWNKTYRRLFYPTDGGLHIFGIEVIFGPHGYSTTPPLVSGQIDDSFRIYIATENMNPGYFGEFYNLLNT